MYIPAHYRLCYYRLLIITLFILCWVCGCSIIRPVSQKIPASSPSNAGSSSVLTDPDYLYSGSEVCTRDLRYLKHKYQIDYDTISPTRTVEKQKTIQATIDFIQQALTAAPQAIYFRCEKRAGVFTLTPIRWHNDVKVTAKYNADLVIVGAELQSLTTAMDAADRGFSVILLYAGPLGGISAESGANMRYFDCIEPTYHPPTQLKLFRDGLHMGNIVAIPPDTSQLINAYLTKLYKNRIRLINTSSYDALHVTRAGKQLQNITTDEGVQVTGRNFIDSDPESRVAEKAGLPMDLNTPHLSFGLVFTVKGITEHDWTALQGHQRVLPETLMKMAGVNLAAVQKDKYASASYQLLLKAFSRDFFLEGQNDVRNWKLLLDGSFDEQDYKRNIGYYRWGYLALAQGFNFYMQCRGIADPTNNDLEWLNSRRTFSGLNIAYTENDAVFNSMSYYSKKNILQYSHSLTNDADFRPIKNVDIPELQKYLRYVSGNQNLVVRMPDQFYVRTSSAFFPLLFPYTSAEFTHPSHLGMYHTTYGMDFRDLRPRDHEEGTIINKYIREMHGKRCWYSRASATYTEIGNLFLLNKCGVTPAYSGGQRILSNQINAGAALMQTLGDAKK